MRTIDKIIDKVSCRFGSPMGRSNIQPQEFTIIENIGPHSFLVCPDTKQSKIIFDSAVPMCGAYDRGGVYWGLGSQLRVSYTKDLSFIKFYRK